MKASLARTESFCRRFSLKNPILLAPMAGSSPTSLSIAVANAGGMGACGALPMQPEEILSWVSDFRAKCNGSFQINNWIRERHAPARNFENEARIREFLKNWGPAVPESAGEVKLRDFDAQTDAMIQARPPVISSIMGLFSPAVVKRIKNAGISWFATVTTLAEAKIAAEAGADVLIAQGSEAGGHRGAFDTADAERKQVGLFSLVPSIVDAVDLPVVAAGGIADGRGVAAALLLGASAVQIGTGFLRCPEARIPSAWADALARTDPENTVLTRAFSGRAGRSIATEYVLAAESENAPTPAPYPIQRGLTAPMRTAATQANDVERMQAWAGQSAAFARRAPAETLVRELWESAKSLLQ
jgi:nitronate monooxygenase